MTRDPEPPSRFSWIVPLFDPTRPLPEPSPVPYREWPASDSDDIDDEPPSTGSDDFPGWDTMIMALMA